MKLRIRGNTLRLRLTQSEVNTAGELLPVREETPFSNQVFVCALLPSENDKFDAIFRDNVMSVYVPAQILQKWAQSNEVGFEAEIDCGLKILVEKDFKCLTERSPEEDADTFPNPLAGHSC